MTEQDYNLLVWLAAKAGYSNGCEAPEVLLPRLYAAKRRERDYEKQKNLSNRKIVLAKSQ